MSEKLIPIAHIQRHHGIPRDGVFSFKARLPMPGTEIFSDIAEVYLSSTALAAGRTGESPNWQALEWRKVKIAKETKPSGGKWEEAPMVIVSFFEKDLEAQNFTANAGLKNHWIAAERSQFPPLNESEFFLCDLYGCEVQDEEGVVWGQVAEVYELGQGSYNLVVKLSEGHRSKQHSNLEVPAQWIDWDKSELAPSAENAGILCIPRIQEWLL